jgi:plasmid stability protein
MAKQARTRTGRATGDESRNVQYTVREIPPYVDRALRARARETGKSLNEVVRETLAHAAGASTTGSIVYDDLDYLAGRWREDLAFDEAIAAQDTVDEDLWR